MRTDAKPGQVLEYFGAARVRGSKIGGKPSPVMLVWMERITTAKTGAWRHESWASELADFVNARYTLRRSEPGGKPSQVGAAFEPLSTTQHLAYTDADVNRSLAPSRGREVEAGEYEQRQARRFQHRAWARPGLESALERSQPRCRADGDARALGTIACVGRLGTGPSDTGHGWAALSCDGGGCDHAGVRGERSSA
ncbi:hypothetical protein PaG_05225 [Moesziomyces aphidis]|uniref:Uncharacterized protein n=1 Tax=Moesziomyces aphidis TaxID=84754 RepID=W3VKK2_MOEAP|nr:hypothetical protein PaG_05225 [Moesziomyces aphidis]